MTGSRFLLWHPAMAGIPSKEALADCEFASYPLWGRPHTIHLRYPVSAKTENNTNDRRRRIYEGKAKILYEGPEPGTLIQFFKDDATAFNKKKHEVIDGKGVLNNRICEYIFSHLNKIGIPTHFIRRLNMREQLIKEVEMIPLEIVVRNVAAGSLSKRLGIEEGVVLPRSIIEFYYKSDALEDPMVSEEHITAFGWANPAELDDIMALAIRVNDFMTGLFLGVGIQLVDFKIECGRLFEGDMMRIILADEISPDSCRLWDVETREKMDKDRFRRDMGGLLEAYSEVARRLGIINENEPVRGTGPVLVKHRQEQGRGGAESHVRKAPRQHDRNLEIHELRAEHAPHEAGLVLDSEGWVSFDDLKKVIFDRFDVTEADILEVIESNPKKRFTLLDHRIRYFTEHRSKAAGNPRFWAEEDAASSRSSLTDVETAKIVATRRKGDYIILEIDAARMHAEGHSFFVSDNGVWLTITFQACIFRLSRNSIMKSAVVQLPGLNRDRDMIAALTKISGHAPVTVWQTETEIPDVDLIVIPGGFSYGDYLRCGAIAARMPIMQAIKDKADKGVKPECCRCADAQCLAEVRLPRSEAGGRQRRNGIHQRLCQGPGHPQPGCASRRQLFRRAGDAEGNRGNGQVVFRYAEGTNPNGSVNDIAGVINAKGNVLGMMPHPENLIEAAHGGNDGRASSPPHSA
ncbi:SAICAR synthetase domain-containing protein [Ditylenchus destructor]|uniref:SAICAR synthetase domain-containing protein n=1 Tax=Ditylenchus destructor TaxID=166010 RepID=A0AAD4MF79_9BILA|nr:SAICAR synthetase domain-containing protein [Ditylenchus destructor]